MKEKILELIKKEEFIDNAENVSDVDILLNSFEAMEFSSISYIKLLVLIETEFDIEFPDEYLELYAFKCIDDIIDYLKNT